MEDQKIHTYLEDIDYHYIPALKGKEFFSELMSDIYDVLSEVSEEDLRNASKPLQDQVDNILLEVATELQVALKSPSKPKLPTNLRSVFRLIQFEAKGIDLDRRGDGIRVRHVPSLVKFLCDLKSQRSGRYKSLHVWGLEEPENSVDFISAFELRDQILNIIKDQQFQIAMATHSPIFFSMESNDNVSTRFFTQEEGKTLLSEDSGNISDEMGVLRVVYPYVKQSRDEVETMKQTLEGLRSKVEDDMVDPSKRMIFVEGDSDVEVLSAVNDTLQLIRDARFVAAIGDSNACANSVADNSIAWHFLQRNRPIERRVKAVGLVDGDEAGQVALDRFLGRMEGETNFHAKIEKLRPSKELAQRYRKLGFVPNVSLESFFPIELWENAKHSDWLELKSTARIFSICDESLREKIFRGGLADLESQSSDIIPIIYDVKIENKKKMSRDFLKMLEKDGNLATPFKVSLSSVRGIINKELV